MRYHPVSSVVLTYSRKPGEGHSKAGSLTGAVASQRVTEAPNGPLGPGGNRPSERIGRRGPDCEADMPSRGESRAK